MKNVEFKNGYALVDPLNYCGVDYIDKLPVRKLTDVAKDFKEGEEVFLLRNFDDDSVGKIVHVGVYTDDYSSFDDAFAGHEDYKQYYVVVKGTKKR